MAKMSDDERRRRNRIREAGRRAGTFTPRTIMTEEERQEKHKARMRARWAGRDAQWLQANNERRRILREKGYGVRHRAKRSAMLAANPDLRARINASALERYHSDEENRLKYRVRHYGLTVPLYDEMGIAQAWLCAICRKPLGRNCRNTHIDHDHVTEQVRGLLCGRCNTRLAVLEDDWFESAVSYLRRWAAK